MPRISSDKYFSLCTGGLIKSVKELAFAMDYLSDEELNHHVNESKNDFSSWVRDVFKEYRLAEIISDIKDRKEMQIVLLKHLVNKKR
ncbi:hypothetical protein KY332_00850 [Candidatus Woesearchaeota archaeon]|nr:hypothetical protein [Candidatus Woesearchaeota archaeon]